MAIYHNIISERTNLELSQNNSDLEYIIETLVEITFTIVANNSCMQEPSIFIVIILCTMLCVDSIIILLLYNKFTMYIMTCYIIHAIMF